MHNPFKGKTIGEIMIEIGQDPWGDHDVDDEGFKLDLTLSGREITRLVSEILLELEAKINPKYIPLYKNQLRSILANLVDIHTKNPDSYIFYSRDRNFYQNSKRYNPNGVSYRPLIFLIDELAKNNWLKTIKHRSRINNNKGRRSKIAPSQKLLGLFKRFKVSRKHICCTQIESIRLKDSNKRLIEYEDTDFTRSCRTKLLAYNMLLIRSKINLKKTDNTNLYLKNNPIDYNKINYFRVFNDGSFGLGGRFYGPWWMGLSKTLRRNILINGHKTIELDYGSINIHLLYSELGINYYALNSRFSDPYILTDVDADERDVNKTIINVGLNHANTNSFTFTVKEDIKRQNIKRQNSGDKKLLKVPNAKEIWRRIKIFKKDHAPLKHYLFSGVAKRLQFKDSCIAEDIIEAFIIKNIPILVIHDSFIVQYWNKDLLYRLMNEVYRKHRFTSVPKIK